MRKRRHGFRARMETQAAQVIAARRARGRKRLSADGGQRADAGSMERLRQRADFLPAARGSEFLRGFLLQARRRDDGGPARFGFTVSLSGHGGGAQPCRRRLKEVVRRAAADGVSPDRLCSGRRREALTRPFAGDRGFGGALHRSLRARAPRGGPRRDRRTTAYQNTSTAAAPAGGDK